MAATVSVAAAAPAGAGASAMAPPMAQFRRLWEERSPAAGGLAEGARADAVAELLAHGLPLRRDEEWVHTPLRSVAEAHYRLGGAVPGPAADGPGAALVRELVAGEPVALLTCNGALASPAVLASLTGGTGGDAHDDGADAVRGPGQPDIPGVRGARGDLWPRCREAFTRPLTTAFTRLARAFGDHAVLHCDAAAGAAPLHLVHLVEAGVLAAPRVTIRIADGARVTLVESCVAVAADTGGAPDANADNRAAANGAAPDGWQAASGPASAAAAPNGAPWDGGRPGQAQR